MAKIKKLNPDYSSSSAPKTEQQSFPREKFPFLCSIEKDIDLLKDIIACLNLRKELHLSLENKATKRGSTEITDTDYYKYESNERQLLYLKTDLELAETHAKLKKNQEWVDSYITKTIIPNVDVIDDLFEKNLAHAIVLSEKNDSLKKFIATEKEKHFPLFESDWGYKFEFFAVISKFIANHKKENAKRQQELILNKGKRKFKQKKHK